MAILNYTTKISVEMTTAQIQKILIKAGADAVMCEFKNGKASSMTFRVTTAHGPLHLKLPAQVDGVLKAMERDVEVKRSACTLEQAARVAWRILKDWIEAQMAIIEAGMATLPQVFLPYAMTDDGGTVYERFEGGGILRLTGGK